MKQQTLEEAIDNYVYKTLNEKNLCEIIIKAIKFGAKWQQERSYSDEELKEILGSYADWSINGDCTYYEWFEQFKKK